MTTPNKISMGRLAMSLLMILAAAFKAPNVFLVAFCISLLSDYADGFLARTLHQESSAGATLDTCGDVTMYISAVVGGWFLWPDLIKQEAVYIITALSLIAVSALLSLLKHHRFPSYHTWSAKFATTVIGITALLMFAGISSLPFRISVIALTVSALEEMAITIILPRWQPNVRSIFYALKLREKNAKTDQPA